MTEKLYPTGEVKKAWQSKTLWTNAIMALASFFPIIATNLSPEVISTIFLGVNTALRFMTNSGVSIK